MEKEFLKETNFNLIRYANCWEDADLMFEVLAPPSGGNILSIASAGDNCFALLKSNPEKLIAIDVSYEQLYLTELKQVAIKAFDHSTFLGFVGVTTSEDRKEKYYSIRDAMSLDAKSFWNERLNIINEGLIYSGKFEKYFKFFRQWILMLIHSKKNVDLLFKIKSSDQQVAF